MSTEVSYLWGHGRKGATQEPDLLYGVTAQRETDVVTQTEEKKKNKNVEHVLSLER